MVGHRVSQAELYDDRDVIIQILKLKDTVNDYAGGIIDSINVVGDDLVIDWADGTSVSLPLPSPTGISSIAGSISGTNLTITIYMTDGSSHAFTTPLNGIATESYVNDAIAAIPDELPDTTGASVGYILGLDANKDPEWQSTPVRKIVRTFNSVAEMLSIVSGDRRAGDTLYIDSLTDGTNSLTGARVVCPHDADTIWNGTATGMLYSGTQYRILGRITTSANNFAVAYLKAFSGNFGDSYDAQTVTDSDPTYTISGKWVRYA